MSIADHQCRACGAGLADSNTNFLCPASFASADGQISRLRSATLERGDWNRALELGQASSARRLRGLLPG
jgi:hypothetical protein